jgi:hypothetical protein
MADEPKFEPTEADKEMRAAVFSALTILSAMRGTEVLMRWEGAKAGLLMNLPSLAWVGYRATIGYNRSELFGLVVGAIASALLNQYLYTSLRRSGKHFVLWNTQAIKIESKLPAIYDIQIFTSLGYKRLQRNKVKINDLLLWVTQSCMIIWAVIGVMAFGAAAFGGFK